MLLVRELTQRGSSVTRRSLLTRSLGSLTTRGTTCIFDVPASTATGSPDLDAHGAMTATGSSVRGGTVAPSSTVSAGCVAPGVGLSGYAARSTPRGGLPVWAAALTTRPPPSGSTTSIPSAPVAQTRTTTSSRCACPAIGPRPGKNRPPNPLPPCPPDTHLSHRPGVHRAPPTP